MNKSTSSFGIWLAQRRKSHDLTQEELAQRVGCSAALIRKIEAHSRKPSKQIVELLADAFDIAPEQRDAFRQFARAGLVAEADAALPEAAPAPKLAHFAPTKTYRTNLVAQPTALMGREWDVAAIKNRLMRDDARLVTLVGPPGIGKTRLSIEVARSLLNDFADGVYFVPLAPVAGPAFVVQALAQVLDVTLRPNVPADVTLRQALRDKQMLLVLDNFEHVLPAAGFVDGLLAGCVWLKAIVTSRASLHLRIERQVTVYALALPASEAQVASPDTLGKYASVALFVERAQAVRADFALTAHNARAVHAICSSLEGVPLAIELAASWVSMLGPDEIATEIKRNLDFLQATMQDMPERHRSLRAAFDHSWGLLTDAERSALCGLSIFCGGFTRDAAEQIAGAPLPTLAALVSKSLLRFDQSSGRYDFHEFIRQYAQANLREQPQSYDLLLDRHMRWFARLLEDLDAPLRSTAQKDAISRLLPEMDNIRMAWGRALDHDCQIELGAMMHCWGWFLSLTGHDREGHSTFPHAAEVLRARLASEMPGGAAHQADTIDTSDTSAAHRLTFARALFWQGYFDYIAESYDQAIAHFQECISLARSCNDPLLLSDALRLLGMQHSLAGGKVERRRLIVESFAISTGIKNVWSQARCLNALGEMEYGDGCYAETRHFLEQSLALWRVNGDPNETCVCLCYLGATLAQLGEHALASIHLQEGVTLSHDLGDRWLQAFGMRALGIAQFKSGDHAQSQRTLRDSAGMYDAVRDRWGQAMALQTLGESLCASSQYAEARDAYRQSLAIAHRKHWRENEVQLLVCLADLSMASEPASVAAGSTAYELLLHALGDAALSSEFIARAQRLRAVAEARLTPGQLASAQSRVQSTTLDEAVQELLN